MRKGIHIVIREISRFKLDLWALIIFGSISAVANGAIPYIIGRFIDALIKTVEGQGVRVEFIAPWVLLLILWLGIQLVANIIDWMHEKKSGSVSIKIETNYLSESFGALLFLPLSFHKTKKLGEVGDALSRAANWLDQIVSNVVFSLAPQFLSVLFGFGVVFWIQPIIAGILAFGVVLYILFLRQIVPPAVPLLKKGYEAYGDAYGDAYGALTNIQAIKHAAAEEHEQKKIFGKFTRHAAGLWFQVIRIWASVNVSQRIIVTGVQLSIFLFSVHMISKSMMSIGDLIAMTGYAAMVFGPFVRVGHQWQMIQNGLTALERAETLITAEPERYTPDGAIVFENLRGDIEFDRVTFSYQKKDPAVLKDISFSIRAGERIALVGESGVGKSTLIDLISAYYFPDIGHVRIDGVESDKVNLKQLRSHIAIVPQEVVLFNDTVLNNIKYGSFRATKEQVYDAAKKAHADQFIESFPKKYQQLVGERGIKLSTGQKQRIAIARALLRNPSILILDEPTSALDIHTEKYITESLEELMRGRTTIIIAHRLSTVRRADRIFVLEKGSIVEAGTHDELLLIDNGLYRKLHNLHLSLG